MPDRAGKMRAEAKFFARIRSDYEEASNQSAKRQAGLSNSSDVTSARGLGRPGFSTVPDLLR
jgi:hypothetical protein